MKMSEVDFNVNDRKESQNIDASIEFRGYRVCKCS